MCETLKRVRPTGEGAALDAAAPVPPESRECIGRAARRLFSVLAVALVMLHLPVSDASAQTAGVDVQRDGEEPGSTIVGSADARCGSVSPHSAKSLGHAPTGASARGGTLGVWWPTPECGSDPVSDYSVQYLEAEDAPKWRMADFPSDFIVTLKSSSTGRLDIEWSYGRDDE